MSSARRALLVATVLLKRRIRRALDRPLRTGVTLVPFLFPFAVLVAPRGVGGAGFAMGPNGTVSNGEAAIDIAGIMPGVFAGLWLFIFLGGAFAVDDRLDDIDAGDLLVLAGGVRATVLGVTLAGNARRLALFGIWFAVGAVTVVFAGGGVTSLPVGAVGFVLLLASASMSGHAVGLFVRRELLERGYRTQRAGMAMFVVGWLAVVGLEMFGGVARAAFAVTSSLPPAWFAEWLLLEYPGRATDPGKLLGSAAFGVVVTVAGFAAKERLAADVWFRDPGTDDGGGQTGFDPVGPVRRVARPLVGPAAAALAWRVVLRRLRSPLLLSLPVVVAFVVEHDVRHALSPAQYPLAAALYAGIALPAAVALNPLADEGVGLPVLLRSELDGRGFVTGYAVAATLFAWVGTALVAVAVAVVYGTDPRLAVAALVVVIPVTLGAASVAVAAGVVFPRTDAHAVTASEGIGLPSKFGFVTYLLTVVGAAVPFGLVGLLGAPTTALLAGAAASAVLLGAVALAAVRLTARRFDGFVLE
jgi:hypothetical protein